MRLISSLAPLVLMLAACSEPGAPAAVGGEPGTASKAAGRRSRDVSPPYLEAQIQSINRDVLVALYQPESAIAGLPKGAQCKVGPDGRVVYKHYGDLYVVVADPVSREAGGDWSYPDDPVENDERLAAPACEGGREGSSNPDAVGTFWIDPEGRVAYRCPYQDREPGLHYVDGPTIEMSGGVIRSLGSKSRALGLGGRYQETWGIDDRGTFTPIDRPRSWNAMREPNLFLADQEGFLVVLLNRQDSWDRDGLGLLLRVSYDGSVEEIGTYGPPVESLMPSGAAVTLAPAGELYVLKRRSDDDVVLRFRPDSEPGGIAYRVGTGSGTFYRDPWQLGSVLKWGG